MTHKFINLQRDIDLPGNTTMTGNAENIKKALSDTIEMDGYLEDTTTSRIIADIIAYGQSIRAEQKQPDRVVSFATFINLISLCHFLNENEGYKAISTLYDPQSHNQYTVIYSRPKQ